MSGIGKEVALEVRCDELAQTCAHLQRQLARAKGKSADLVAAVERAALESASIAGRGKAVKAPKRDKRPGGEVALLHLTDWQLGKQTESYDTEVCRLRVMTAVAKVLRLTEIQRAAHPVDEIHVMLGGDLIENVTIFKMQPFEVDSSATMQVFAAATLIESVLLTLLENFERVVVHEVRGNHGRIGLKGETPDNWDRVVGRIVRERLIDPRLAWEAPDNWYAIGEIGEYRFLLVHGDQVKSFGGNTPAFGIIRKATAWSSGVLEGWDDLYLGHYHHVSQFQIPNGGRVFMTGSTESGSEYAREFVSAKGKASQRLHFVDPRAGRVTAEYVIWLD
jgi:hypothetical protein